MIKTHVTWLIVDNTLRLIETGAKVTEMTAQEKTDGNWTKINETSDRYTIERSWIDINAASEWITFITTYNPVSAVVVE